jgi:L-amino acid N-acyltransferase YncA
MPPAASPVAGDGGPRRPLNPFLSKDPNQRAKRLARALVSDIITYHPAKHAEGLRDGTLKQLFREEIKKSFEEYIAQVGQQLAESTTYFQEALNEVLGAGKKIF